MYSSVIHSLFVCLSACLSICVCLLAVSLCWSACLFGGRTVPRVGRTIFVSAGGHFSGVQQRERERGRETLSGQKTERERNTQREKSGTVVQ